MPRRRRCARPHPRSRPRRIRPCRRDRLGGQQRDAERAHQVAVGVHEHVHPQHVLERAHHARVLAHAALEHHGCDDLLSLAHVVQVVRRHRAAEPRDDVLARVAHLYLVHQVALGEHGAARRDVGRPLGRERDGAEFLHLHAEPRRAFFQPALIGKVVLPCADPQNRQSRRDPGRAQRRAARLQPFTKRLCNGFPR